MSWLYFTILNIAVIILLHDKLVRRLEHMDSNVFFARRVQLGLTQVELSKKTGVSQQLISKIENDRYFNIYQFATLKKLCDYLQIDIRKLNIYNQED